MATIDRDQLYQDDITWLPETNVLTEAQIRSINEYIITDVGDNDLNYPEVLCKSLRAIAYANVGKASAESSGLKKEKVGDNEQEWFDADSAKRVWEDYIDSLKDICPIFGYYGLKSSGGIKITTSPDPDINPCVEDNNLEF